MIRIYLCYLMVKNSLDISGIYIMYNIYIINIYMYMFDDYDGIYGNISTFL